MKKLLLLLSLMILFIGCPSAPKNAAKIYIERGEYTSAKEQILVGLKTDPTDYELYCLLAKTEIGLSNWIDASKAFQDGIKIDSVNSMNWLFKDKKNISVYWQGFYNAAVALMVDKKYDEALRNLEFCKTIDPGDVNTYILEGGIYSELDNKEMASKAYVKALSIDPENPEAYFLIGKALFEKKSYDSSLVKFNEAIKYFEIKYNRTAKMIFQNLPEIDKILTYKIIKLWVEKKNDELDELVKVKLGFDAGLNAQRRNIEKFFKITEGLARSYYLSGMAYYNLKNDSLALKNLLKSLDLMPEDLDALFFTGEILMLKLQEYQNAIKYFEKLTQLKDDDVGAWYYIGACHFHSKEYKKAIDILEGKIVSVLDPKNIGAMEYLVHAYRELGNSKKALEYLMKLKKLKKEQ